MEKNIAIPLSIIEPILRLLDGFGDLERLNFHIRGYNPRFEYENAIWELRMKIRPLQRHLTETYLLTIGDITEDESRALREWIEAGNSVYSNPCLLYDDSGQPMDFINGCRTDAEMAGNPSSFFGEVPDTDDISGLDDGLPF